MATPYTNRSTASSVSESSMVANARGGQSMYPSSRIYGERGNIWQYSPTSAMSPRPRLAKIKSSPSNGALAAARTAGQQPSSRLHKRNHSASNPGATDPATAKVLLSDEYALASPKSTAGSKTKVKMKPLLRKFASRDEVNDRSTATIDLSRSAAENEGLGIFTSHRVDAPSYGIYNGQARPGATANRHQRSNSQLSSTTTTSSRYNYPPYANPIHPSASSSRPYASPINTSIAGSLSSDHLPLGATSLTNSETSYLRQTSPSTSRKRPNLHIRHGSSSRTTGIGLTHPNTSQTNLPGTPSSLRNPLSASRSPDPMPPPAGTTTSVPLTARSSFDSVFTRKSKRSRANTAQEMDPATQAATVAALRQQFDEKERKKQEKYDEEDRRKMDKVDEKRRREASKSAERLAKVKSKEDLRRRKRAGTDGAAGGRMDEKAGGAVGAAAAAGYAGRGGTRTAMATKPTRSKWQLFLFKLRTMWLRMKKGMGVA